MRNRITNLKKPLWFGFSIAPLAAPIAYAIWALLFWTDPTPKQEFSGFDAYAVSGWAIFFTCATLVSYIFSIIFGLPLITTLQRLNKLTFWRVVLFSVPLGAIAFTSCFMLLLALGATTEGNIWSDIVTFLWAGGALGLIVATVFCLLVGITGPSK